MHSFFVFSIHIWYSIEDIDAAKSANYCPEYEIHDSRSWGSDRPARRRQWRRPPGSLAARRDPATASRLCGRRQHRGGRPCSGATTLRDAGNLQNTAARGAQGAGRRRPDRTLAQSRRPGAPAQPARPRGTVRCDGRAGEPRRPAGLRSHHGRGDHRDRAATLRDVRPLFAPRHARLFPGQSADPREHRRRRAQ